MVRQDVTLHPLEIHRGGAEIHLQPIEDPTVEQERSVKSPTLEDRAAETTWTDGSPYSPSTCTAEGEGKENWE